MRKLQILKYLILVIMVLPLFYEYFKFLPGASKYILDVFIVFYFLNFKQSINKQSGFTKLYVGYISVIALITIFSLVIHNESISFFVQELRRLVIPLLLYYIVSDVFRSYKYTSINLHRFLALIMLCQIPLTIIQSVFYSTFRSLDVFASDRFHMDAAAGTLGAGGHSYLGILIPLTFIYLYDLKMLKYSIPFLIPLVLINSGGGVVLFGFVMASLGMYSLFSGPVVYRVRVIAGVAVLIGMLAPLSQTQFARQTVRKYISTYYFYQEHYIEGGKETFVGQDYKLSRINGFKFLEKKMDAYDYEHFIGLGFEFQNFEGSKRSYGFKSDLNAIIAERGFLGLAAHGIFLMLLLLQIYGSLKKNKYDQVFVKMMFFVTFFVAGFYNQTSRSALIWFVIIYFMVLFENPVQYRQLLEYLGFKKGKATSSRSKTPHVHKLPVN